LVGPCTTYHPDPRLHVAVATFPVTATGWTSPPAQVLKLLGVSGVAATEKFTVPPTRDVPGPASMWAVKVLEESSLGLESTLTFVCG